MKKRIITIITISLILVVALSGVAFADSKMLNDDLNTRASNYLNSYIVGITAQGDNKLKVSFTVLGKRTMDEIGVLEIEIERNSGNGWEYDRTLDHEDYSNFIKYDSTSNKSSTTFTGIRGDKYRATITAYAADVNGSDSKYATTQNPATCY